MKWSLVQKSATVGFLATAIVYFLSAKSITPTSKYLAATYEIEILADNYPLDSSASQDKALVEIHKRLEQLGYDFTIKRISQIRYKVNIPKAKDSTAIFRALSSPGHIQFRELYHFEELLPMLQNAADTIQARLVPNVPVKTEKTDTPVSEIDRLVVEMEKEKKNDPQKTVINELINFNRPDGSHTINEIAEIGLVRTADTTKVRELFSIPEIKNAGPADAMLCFGTVTGNTVNLKGYTNWLYFYKTYGTPGKALLENKDVREASSGFGSTGKPWVEFRFTEEGAQKWEVMTERNINHSIAILLDGQIISAPRVISAITGGYSSLTGDFTEAETRILAMQLKGSVIPAKLKVLSAEIKPGSIAKGQLRRLLLSVFVFILTSVISGFVLKTLSFN